MSGLLSHGIASLLKQERFYSAVSMPSGELVISELPPNLIIVDRNIVGVQQWIPPLSLIELIMRSRVCLQTHLRPALSRCITHILYIWMKPFSQRGFQPYLPSLILRSYVLDPKGVRRAYECFGDSDMKLLPIPIRKLSVYRQRFFRN